MALTDNLIAYYKFDSDQTTDSLGSFNLTKTGTVNSATGKINSGCDFSAGSASNYLSYPDSASLDPSNISVQAWINFTSTVGVQAIVAKWWDGSQRSWELFYDDTPRIGFDVANSGSNTDHLGLSSSSVSTGTWYHVVGTYDGTTVKVYVNGTVGGTTGTLSGGLSGNSVQMTIGVDGRSTPIQPFKGYIDEVAIWSRALTSTEITQLYNSGSGLQYPFSGGATVNSNFFALM